MLRVGLLASVLPLVLAGGTAPAWLGNPPHPCIAAGSTTVQMARLPWQGDIHVAFTRKISRATVRVQQVEDPDLADFVVTDDAAGSEDATCGAAGASQFVAIVDEVQRGEPVIYLSAQANADYRIFVHSTSFSAREAAALVVGAHVKPLHLAAADER